MKPNRLWWNSEVCYDCSIKKKTIIWSRNKVSISLTSDCQWAEKIFMSLFLLRTKYPSGNFVTCWWRGLHIYSITRVIFSSFFSPHAVVWAQLVGFYSDSCIPTNLDSWIVTALWKVLCCAVWTWIALMFLFLVSIVFSKLARAVSWLVIQTNL